MVEVGDRFHLRPCFSGEWKDSPSYVGTVIAVYPRFAVVKFPGGFLECFFLYGEHSLEDAARAKKGA